MLDIMPSKEGLAASEKAMQVVLKQPPMSREEAISQARTKLGTQKSEPEKPSNTSAQQIQQEAVDWLLTDPEA